ncbi:MAG: hypothetical protein H6720_05615 [Sandaracinus sp.]|nr:hypothetical protein [Sandaracinus sp.]
MRPLWRRKWLLLGLFTFGAAGGVLLAKFAVPRSFTSQAMLRFEGIPTVEGATPVGAIPEQPSARLGAMVQSLHTDAPLREIGQRMGMEEVPPHAIGALFQAEYDMDRVLRVTVSSSTGEEAARFANTVVEVFLETQLEAERRRYLTVAETMQERINVVEQALSAARAAYDSFRTEQGITDLTAEQEAAIEESAGLRASRDQASSEIVGLEARIEQLRRELRSTPRNVTTVVSGASPEEVALQEARSQLTIARASLATDHPRVLALEAQVARLEGQVASSMGSRTATSTGSSLYESLQGMVSQAEADLRAMRERHTSLERLVAASQERLRQFSAVEGEASQLLGEVRRNEALLAELQGQRSRVLDAAGNPTHGFTIVSEAPIPEYPDKSKKKLIAAAGVPLGLMFFSVIFLIVGELRGLKVQTPAEVAWWGNGPVVATSSWPREPAALDDLVADLDDFVTKTSGRMLVVSASPEHAETARAFSVRLGRDWMDTTVVGGSPFDDEGGPAYPSLPPSTIRGSEIVLDQGARAHHVPFEEEAPFNVEAWEGPDQGPALRRAARLADRVCVLVPAGMSCMTLRQVPNRLGRDHGIGYVLIGVAEENASLEDRVGPVAAFWSAMAS